MRLFIISELLVCLLQQLLCGALRHALLIRAARLVLAQLAVGSLELRESAAACCCSCFAGCHEDLLRGRKKADE
jgi:hypothetical protein